MSLPIDREKELYSQIEDLRSQLAREYARNLALHRQINFYYSLMEIYRAAAVDIIFCKVPDIPRGAAVSAEQVGVYAMNRTRQAEEEARKVVLA